MDVPTESAFDDDYLRRRGATYCWRRRFTIAGISVPISFSLCLGSDHIARGIMNRVRFRRKILAWRITAWGVRSVPNEYGPRSRCIAGSLDRIMTDQIGNRGEPNEVARANRVYAELDKLRPIPGNDADFTSDHYKDSSAPDWCEDDAECLAALCHVRHARQVARVHRGATR